MRLVFEKVKTSPMPFFVKPVAKGIANKTNEVFIGPMIKMHLDFVESHLAKNTWFLGDNLSAADIQMSFPLEASVARSITGKNRPSIIALEKGGEYDFA
jgi:glutathione S-transferase